MDPSDSPRGPRDRGEEGGAGEGEAERGGTAARRIGREYYDRSRYFEADAGHLHDMESRFQRYRIAHVLRLARPGRDDRVLDLGCGWGTFSLALAPRVKEVVGVDFSQKSIDLCVRRLEGLNATNVTFLRRDAGDTRLAGESFDLVVAADLFEHLYPDDARRVVAEAHRVLESGGRFAIWTPHRGHLLEILKNRGIVLKPDPSHVDYKSMERLRRMLVGEGFDVEEAYYAESHLPGLRTLERLLLRFVPLFRRRIAILARKPR